MKAIILAGGFGTRLREITNNLVPKCMVRVMDKPIIDYVVRNMWKQGITDITLSLHYQAQAFMDFYGAPDDLTTKIKYKIEQIPLGTGGAIKHCISGNEPVLVCNGDTVSNVDYHNMLESHIAPLTVAKTENGVSAGIYIINPELFDGFPEQVFSFENDVIPKLPYVAYYTIPWFTDVGTPEGYAKANND